MRAMLLLFASAALLAATSVGAVATPQAQRPATPAPAASAAYDQRERWCEQYVAWLVANSPRPPLPSDVRPTHVFEVEFNSCKPNPQDYERETRQQAAQITPAQYSLMPGERPV